MAKSIGLPMVAREDARVLILGTLPGAKALQRQEYYAHRQDCFWKIMGELVGFSPDLPYEERLCILKSNRIAVWNVLAEAERAGSADANIKAPAPNDFSPFFAKHAEFKVVCFNGQEAERLFRLFIKPTLTNKAAALPRRVMPSTNPANPRMRFEKKLSYWRGVVWSGTEPGAIADGTYIQMLLSVSLCRRPKRQIRHPNAVSHHSLIEQPTFLKPFWLRLSELIPRQGSLVAT